MDGSDLLSHERRARLAAERMLVRTRAELGAANRQLSGQARALSVEVIEQREAVEEALEGLAQAQTRQVIAERRLWTALTSIRDGFAVFDPDDRLVAANPAWLAPFDGLTAVAPGASYREILQLGLDEGTFDIGQERPADWLERMLARRETAEPEATMIRLWDGAFIRLLDVRAEGGDRVNLALNMTGQVMNERRLREAQQVAEAASQAKTAFLAKMSHELRTPMSGVVGMADLLAETQLDAEQLTCVDTIRSSGEALLQIINDVLDYSRLEAERMVLHPAVFDLERLVHDVLRLMQPLAARRSLVLTVDYDMFLPTRFLGDGGRIRQVLTNLVGNAVKFTETGHVLVRVTGVAAGGGGATRVHMTVEDTGIGIAPGMLEHVFGEFNQVEDSRSRRFEGTGLGLAITRRLVALMDGEIWAESEPGTGSTFGVRLDLPAEAEAVQQLPEGLAGRTVAVVDPVPVSAAVLAGQLRALGLDVLSFADGAEALAALPADCAAIFAVAQLPDMTAAALAGALAGDGLDIPVHALAAAAGRPGAEGCASVLVRPVTRAALRRTVAGLAPAARPAAGASRRSGRRPMRVLAAEDNAVNRLVFDKMLRRLDVELRFAVNGRQAVEMHAAWQPDVIFMDISMPEMDGKEATRRIRQAEGQGGGHVPIVALTAHALSGDEAEFLAAGMDHYLSKPLQKPALLERLQAARPPDCRPPLPPPSPGAAAAPAPPGAAFQSRRTRVGPAL